MEGEDAGECGERAAFPLPSLSNGDKVTAGPVPGFIPLMGRFQMLFNTAMRLVTEACLANIFRPFFLLQSSNERMLFSFLAMKPTVHQVELALGVKADDWDCVAPEELVDTIYRLSVEEDSPLSDQCNVRPLKAPKLPGKGSN